MIHTGRRSDCRRFRSQSFHGYDTLAARLHPHSINLKLTQELQCRTLADREFASMRSGCFPISYWRQLFLSIEAKQNWLRSFNPVERARSSSMYYEIEIEKLQVDRSVQIAQAPDGEGSKEYYLNGEDQGDQKISKEG